MSEEKKIKARNVKGTRDYLSDVTIAKEQIILTIKNVFEKYGFSPLDSPALEYAETLVGYGETSKKIFYSKTPEDEDIALRFDLTVPLSRIVSQYKDLPKPFKRYQVANVWRADKPDPGRFREFLQFDIDIVGSSSVRSEVEIVFCVNEAIQKIGIENFQIKINNRKILDTLLTYANIPFSQNKNVFRTLDKLDKISLKEIELELTCGRIDSSGDKITGLNLNKQSVEKIIQFLSIPKQKRFETLNYVENFFKEVSNFQNGILELKEICGYLDEFKIPEEKVVIDLSLARGLDYYTGTVFEAILNEATQFGSIFGGGRYDDLVKRFLNESIPSVGGSIGVDRIFSALQYLDKIDFKLSVADIFITVMDKNLEKYYQQLAQFLRQNNFKTEIYLGKEKSFGKQLQYADKLQIPIALIIGSNEYENKEVLIKDLRIPKIGEENREKYLEEKRKMQITVPEKDLILKLKEILNA